MQEALVAAYAAAAAADPALGADASDLAAQADQQLAPAAGGRAAAAGSSASSALGVAAPGVRAVPGPDPRRGCAARWPPRPTRTPTACLDQAAPARRCSGSIAAGLRGQDGEAGMTGDRTHG